MEQRFNVDLTLTDLAYLCEGLSVAIHGMEERFKDMVHAEGMRVTKYQLTEALILHAKLHALLDARGYGHLGALSGPNSFILRTIKKELAEKRNDKLCGAKTTLS